MTGNYFKFKLLYIDIEKKIYEFTKKQVCICPVHPQ